MQTISPNVQRLVGLLLLVAALSGCAFGGRRLKSTPLPEGTRPQPGQPAIPAEATAPGRVENTAPAAPRTAAGGAPAGASSGAQEQNLLDQISTLEAANQAGDALEDLP